MNINNGLNPYNSNYVNGADLSKMSQSQSLTGSVADSLKEGEIFEGSINSIDNGKVTIGLANGQTMTARLDAGVSITPGQSVFFEVKSNDGNLVQIRPVSLNALEANPTLLKALDMANLVANERTINMVNSLMQNSMSVSPDSLAAMNRAMINNPQVDAQTLVTMAKHGMELTPDNVNMFVNYSNDKAMLIDNFQVISDMLPKLLSSSEISVSSAIDINNAIKSIYIDGASEPNLQSVSNENQTVQITEASQPSASEEQVVIAKNFTSLDADPLLEGAMTNPKDALANEEQLISVNNSAEAKDSSVVNNNGETVQETIQNAKANIENSLNTNFVNSFASDKQISSFNTVLNTLPDFPKDNLQLFAENGTLKADADVNQLFKAITDYFNQHPDIPKGTLNSIVKEPLYAGLLKNIISNSFAMEPEEVAKAGELSKLYERVMKQTDALEKLLANFHDKAADAIKNQTAEIKQNINFMNSANEMYNFVQIPLKMYNQNTDSMLYVRQNKKSSYEAGEEITAFLHFDMEYLGSTDVFISLKEAKVGCKWNLASEASMRLIEANLDVLTERLSKKGFTITSEVTCNEPKTSFLHDFLGEALPEESQNADGLVHRYSFDMRA